MSDTHDAEDLLNDDGTIDQSAVASLANQGNTNGDRDECVDDDTCAEWRRDLRGEKNLQPAVESSQWAASTVRDHLTGVCACDHDVPALEYDLSVHRPAGVWRVPDRRSGVSDRAVATHDDETVGAE